MMQCKLLDTIYLDGRLYAELTSSYGRKEMLKCSTAESFNSNHLLTNVGFRHVSCEAKSYWEHNFAAPRLSKNKFLCYAISYCLKKRLFSPLGHVVWLEIIDTSEVLAASIARGIFVLATVRACHFIWHYLVHPLWNTLWQRLILKVPYL